MLPGVAFLQVSLSAHPGPCSAALPVASHLRPACSASRHPATLLSYCQVPHMLLRRIARRQACC